MFEVSKNSLAFEVTCRDVGKQHLGISPKGASDQLSFETASILLGEPKIFKCVEILYSATITFSEEVIFTLSGAHFREMVLTQKDSKQLLEHTKVYSAKRGDILHVKDAYMGSKLYLFATPLSKSTTTYIGRIRGDFTKHFTPYPKQIRLIQGPEYHMLENPSLFLEQRWKISNESSPMGIKLDGKPIKASSFDIISSSVSDGTIQLTQKGPIVLMRHHQTTGGYPRVYQVALVDIDHLAQCPIDSTIEFEEISMDEAKALHVKRVEALRIFTKGIN